MYLHRELVTLQINLVPSDYRFAALIVPHQLRQLSSQAGEILLTVDTAGGDLLRRRENPEALERLLGWIETLKIDYPHLRAAEADYRPATRRTVGQLYFGRDSIPQRTSRGAFYAYFEGLHQARRNYVLHLDSDMLIGGGSQTWVDEAVSWLRGNPDVLTCTPFPGPPTADLQMKKQVAERLTAPRGAYRFRQFSTRVFLLDKRSIERSERKIRLRRASLRTQARALLEGFSPMALPENLLADYMRDGGQCRVDFLGEEPGLWTLHPPFRDEAFLEKLPSIIQAVESGAVPENQTGDYDLNDSMVDWSSAREALRRNRWWRRYLSGVRVRDGRSPRKTQTDARPGKSLEHSEGNSKPPSG
jgi:hypothetical protein